MATLTPFFSGGKVTYDPIVDKEKFEKELNESINKALQTAEVPVKEKHVRSAIIATWREKSCATFWKCITRYPLDRSNVICYKSCYVIHKVLRDGHPDNVKKSASQAKYISELAKHWNHLGDGVSKMITAYLKVLWNKIAFHVKNPDIPCRFEFNDKPFVLPNDIDLVFQMTVEVFDYQSALLHFYAAVLATIDSVSTNARQCRIAPFVPCVKESAALYDLVFKLMKGLHTSLPADTLKGHRDRFTRQYHALRKYFMEIRKMEYIKKFVDIPELPPDPPNFLIGSYQELLLLQQIVSHDPEDSISSDTSSLVSVNSTPPHQLFQHEATPPLPPRLIDDDTSEFVDMFATAFSNQEFDPFVPETTPPQPPQTDERDILIEQLMREIVELKERIHLLEEQNEANQELIASLKLQIEQRDKELFDFKQVAEEACNENVKLKQEIESNAAAKANSTAVDEEKAKAVEQKFTQLREVYQKLRNEHIQLLRSNGETQKKLNKAESDLLKEETTRLDLEKSVSALTIEVDAIKKQSSTESVQMSIIKETLKSKEMEATQLKQSTSSLQEQLQKSEQSNIYSSIVQAIEQGESIINKTINEVDNTSLTCTPEYLLTRTKNAHTVISTLTDSFTEYSQNKSALGSVLASISSYTQSMCEVILYGAATSHLASHDREQKLIDASKTVGRQCLQLLKCLKWQSPNMATAKNLAQQLQVSIQHLSKEAEELQKEKLAEEEASAPLGDIVDQEMTSTSLAVNEAAHKIEEILKRSREEQTGINLEVNSRILESCTDLMKAIQILIQRSKELQQEIVSEGTGSTHDAKEFYKKHNMWSEGLISAAKQVGYGASILVDSADKVVNGEGKFEALIVNSREIAASTAQLVAASKVKARARSEKLKALKASSRAVSEATGSVVASAQSGADIKAEAATKIDFSKLSLNQTKRLEMESQVRALELEKELEMERTRLAELRKVHYHKAGASEGWDEEEQS